MSRFRFLIILASLLLFTGLWGDGASPIDLCKSYIHIKGFSKYPKTSFYLINGFSRLQKASFSKVTADTVSVIYSGYSGASLLSWDPKLEKLEIDKAEYITQNSILLPDTKKDPKCMTIPLPFIRYQQIGQIDGYYEIRESNGNAGYTIALYKRTYENRSFRIVETGNFNKLTAYLEKNTKQGNHDWTGITFSRADAESLLSYARSLKMHQVTLKPVSDVEANGNKTILKQSGVQNSAQLAPPPKNILKRIRFEIGKSTNVNIHVYQNLFNKALIFSILIELLVLILLFKPICKISTINVRLLFKILIAGVIGTGFTITINWWIFPIFIHQYALNLIVTEAFALIIEALVYAKVFRITLKQALFLSAACNMASYSAGLLLIPYIS